MSNSDSGLCKYRDIIGKPGEGLHSMRLFGLSVYDVVISLAFAIIGSWITGYSVVILATLIFVSGIIVHRLFCVNTALNVAIFGKV
jgi:hypothetical protein